MLRRKVNKGRVYKAVQLHLTNQDWKNLRIHAIRHDTTLAEIFTGLIEGYIRAQRKVRGE